jgi:GntR family phosphonate transport system transcriptional regulator
MSFWSQIASDLAQAIGAGVYAPGERLPSEHSLAEYFGVNRHTIRRALANLGVQGLVRVTQGSGTYVEDFAVELVLGKRMRHQQNLSHVGLRGSMKVLAASVQRAKRPQATALGVAIGSALLKLDILGEAEDQVLHVSERYFPLPRFSQLEAVVRDTGSISAAFAAHGVSDYTRRESRISAELVNAEKAAHLRQPVSRPVLLVESVNVDAQGVPIEFANTWFAGDRVKLMVSHDD